MSSTSFPLRHISVRVPWHDSGWNGSVCQCPARNTACLKLTNIASSKDEQSESALAGISIRDLKQDQFPPCVKERATFMADFAFERLHEHPYVKLKKDTHAHFKPTPLRYPPYTAAALPFRWMNRKFVFGDEERGIKGLASHYPLEDVSESFEPGEELLGFETNWIQDHRNHRTLLDCFWNHVRVEESLVFFYAKQVPLVEDTGKRIIVGVGRVKSMGALTEYAYHALAQGQLRSLLWDRMIGHSIRPDFGDGFLMPYHEALEKSDGGLVFDPSEVVAYAPEDRFDEFSYATEHVRHDTAISTLLACRAALLRASELFHVETRKQEQWIDRELGRLWKKRGPFPGMGAVLCATGVIMGHFIAHVLTEKASDEGSPWKEWEATLQSPDKHLPKELARHIDSTITRAWQRLSPERYAFLQLLSRMELTAEQAAILAVPEDRAEAGLSLEDADFLQNPYLVYEATRLSSTPVALGTVDRGMFATTFIREHYPIPEPALVKTAVDARRLRSLVIRELEEAAARGDTVQAREDVIKRIRHREEGSKDERTDVTADLLAVAEEDTFAGEIRVIQMADGRPAYQLDRFANAGEVIRTTILKRVQAPRHKLAADWRADLDRRLGSLAKSKGADSADERDREEQARVEKAAALGEIAASRFSVLIGPAGTGKTTLLSVLCQRPEVSEGGILLLAPTGKARVRMEAVARLSGTTNFQAYTLAQFLAQSDRYDGGTGRYLLTGEPGEKVARTVIVDECSMLTEEMMAALLEAISGVHRLIFVGDPRQLPPIGAGRPFVDIIRQFTPPEVESSFPRVAPGFAELTIPRRQGAGEREDLQLAAWFGSSATGPGEDQVFEILAGKRKSEHLRFVQWETPDELEQCLPELLKETLGFDPDLQESQAFARSLGAQLDNNGSPWFNVEWKDRPSAGRQAEAWQILTPVRQQPWGVDPLNRFIHTRYRGADIEKARQPGRFASILKPQGDAQIIYGDKVINNRNMSVWKKRIYPEPEKSGYLANGEIGAVVGHRKTKSRNWNPNCLEVEFSTQTGKVFKFYPSDFDDEGDASLDLAYALTVHKAQGSEFDIVFLVLPKSTLMLTRELIYTALTRQKTKVVVLHQGSATDLQKLSSERHSATAVRLTNLFAPPKPVKIGDSFLEERLIHVTSRGEAVRSKSEVIIADHLHANRISYHYEHSLELGGVTKYPDFTIEDDDTGITYYWEHCGMLSVPSYLRRWEEKLQWYRQHGIVPHEEGGGPHGTLIITRDTPNGGISSQEILGIVRSVLLGN